jgi:metal-responsive CopG/Arc/MetJ family transcriptional regulator
MVKFPSRRKLRATTILLDADLLEFIDRIKADNRLRSRSAVIRKILKEAMERERSEHGQ